MGVSRSLKQVLASSLHLLRNTMFSLLSRHAQIDLSNNHLCGVWESINGMEGRYSAVGIKAIAHAVGRGSLTECNVRSNALDVESAKLLAKVATEKRVMLFGIKHDQAEAKFRAQNLEPPDAVLIANDISVSRSLNSIDVGYNDIGQAAALELLAAMKDKDMVSIGMARC